MAYWFVYLATYPATYTYDPCELMAQDWSLPLGLEYPIAKASELGTCFRGVALNGFLTQNLAYTAGFSKLPTVALRNSIYLNNISNTRILIFTSEFSTHNSTNKQTIRQIEVDEELPIPRYIHWSILSV